MLLSCTKEVNVDLPEFQQKVVVEGRIEPNLPPFILLSKTQSIYSETSFLTYLNSLITDARVYINDGTQEFELQLICSNQLPTDIMPLVAEVIGVPLEQLESINFCIYTSLDPSHFGVAGKNYSCRIEYKDQLFTGNSFLFPPQALDSLFWKPAADKPDYGYTHATYRDTPNEYDAYMWEVKRLNTKYGDVLFKKPFTSVFEDIYTDGTTYSFYQGNPFTYNDIDVTPEGRGLFQRGDTVVIKLSKIDKGTFDFENSKIMQSLSNGNPFSSPLNLKSNLKGGCVGAFCAYGSYYDTIVCY